MVYLNFKLKLTLMAYICSSCGKEHQDWPAITYSAPSYYFELSDDEKEKNAELGSDYCMIYHEHQTDRFIRCVLFQKIIDHCSNLEYGLWVSLSESSYKNYADNFQNTNHVTQYFGWLSNFLPDYSYGGSIPTMVQTKTGNSRPEIIPDPEFDHPFVRDYYHGITKEEAEKRIQKILHGNL